MIIDLDRTQERKSQLELETALQKGRLESTRTILESLIMEGNMTDERIAKICKVSVSFVQKVKQELALA